VGKLTQNRLKSLIAKPGRHSDGGGLYFRTIGLDRAYWVYRFTIDGKTREMSVGPYPELGLIEARAKHAELRKKVVVDGADPLAERQAKRGKGAARTVPTFGECADRFLERKEERGQLGGNPMHQAQWRSTLKGLPAPFRDLPVDEIGPKHVFEALDPIWARTPTTASRIRGRIAAVLDDARGPDDVRPNPAAWSGWLKAKLGSARKLGKLDRKTGERVARSNLAAMPYADVPAFMQKLHETTGVAARALQFVILCASRSGEVFGMTFDEIDLDAHMWAVPGSRMKMGKDHSVPLSDAAIDILNAQLDARSEKQVYVFESPVPQSGKVHRDGAHKPLSSMSLMMTMRRLGAGEYTVHGFRSAFRDWAGDKTHFPREVCEAALAHTVGGVEGAYRRGSALEKRRELMAAWAAYLTSPAEAKVVQIGSRRKR
jgi:integrase